MRTERTEMFSTRISKMDFEFIENIGKGNRYDGLQRLIYNYIDADQGLKDLVEKVRELEKVIENKNHVIKYQRELLDKTDGWK